jgi:hypothetical protein
MGMTHYLPAPRRCTNRSPRSRHGSCASDATAVERTRFLVETHFDRRDMLLRDIIKRMRHDGCGGRAGKVELLTGIDGVTSRPVRRIAPMES